MSIKFNTQTRVYDRQKGILSPENKDLESQARQAAEAAIKDAACKGDMFPTVTIEIPNGTC